MNWNDIKVLLAISQAETLSGAARTLGVSQTTVSRRLDALEIVMGTQLVARRRDGHTLTEAGQTAINLGEAMRTAAHDLERAIVGRDAVLSGSIRITTIHLITHYHPDLFTSFAESYPSVALAIDTSSDFKSLTRREADVALRFTNNPEGNLFGRKVARMEFALYAKCDLVNRVVEPTALTTYPWLGFTHASRATLTDAWMKTHVPEARVVCRYEDASAMYAAIRLGAGIGFMPCAFADPDPNLKRLTGVQPGFGVDLWCLTHNDLKQSARVRQFLKHVGDYFRARSDLYSGGPRISA